MAKNDSGIKITPRAKQQVIIVTGEDNPPEVEVNRRLQNLRPGWKIVSATTTACVTGDIETKNGMRVFAKQIHYTTTVVIEWE